LFTNISAKSPTTGLSSFFFEKSLFIEAGKCTAHVNMLYLQTTTRQQQQLFNDPLSVLLFR